MQAAGLNNWAYIRGCVCEEPRFGHQLYGEAFYHMKLCVARQSGTCDYLPVTISGKLFDGRFPVMGESIALEGQVRTYNQMVDGTSRLIVTLFAKQLCDPQSDENSNRIMLSGRLCKPTIYRVTPFSREIADLLIAVNRPFHKSDYIPAIAWGDTAKRCEILRVGDEILVYGRMQSREYLKRLNDGQEQMRIAYEVSINRLELIEDC